MSVSHDEGTAAYSDIHFNDIHMENIEGSSTSGEFLVAPIVIWSLGGGDGPVNNVSLSRVTVDNSGGHTSQIEGYNSDGEISNITLQDVSIDGTTLTSTNYTSKIDVGANVSGLNFGLVSGAVYTFVSEHNGLAMDNGNTTANNRPVIQWPMNLPETTSQQWKVTAVAGDTYNIVNQKSGLALDNQNSSTSGFGLIQSTLTGQSHYEWTITSTGNGFYKVVSAQSSYALDDDNIAPGTKGTNTQVVQYTPNGGGTQQWKLTKQ